MGRKSTICGICSKRGYWRTFLVHAALLVVMGLAACCPKCPEPRTSVVYRQPPPDRVTFALKAGDQDAVISALKALMDDPESNCRAAFYLCAINGARKEYVRVLFDDRCRQKVPAEANVIKNLVYWEKRARKSEKGRKEMSDALQQCREDNDLLEKELLRVQFECRKKEEIRKEAEKWRMK